MKTAAIIQARMTSTRLPGKVMKELVGKPMLAHIIERLNYSKKLDDVIIAMTANQRDDVINELAKKMNVNVFRGSEEDVLDRYYQTAKKYNVDIIVRITSDCSVIDPEVVDGAIGLFNKNQPGVDYVSNGIERTFPRGLDVEVFPFSVLEVAHKKAKKQYQREHVTPYIYQNAEPLEKINPKFRILQYKNPIDYSRYRLTVDTTEDFEVIKRIYEALYKEGQIFLLKDIIKFLEEHPEIAEINKEVKQKKLNE